MNAIYPEVVGGNAGGEFRVPLLVGLATPLKPHQQVVLAHQTALRSAIISQAVALLDVRDWLQDIGRIIVIGNRNAFPVDFIVS